MVTGAAAMEQPGDDPPVQIRPGVAEFARAWTLTCAGASGYLPLGHEETQRLLYGLTLRLVEALDVDEPAGRREYDVGEAMVRAHLTDPSVLDRTLHLLGTEFPKLFPAPMDRLARVQGGVAAGYVFALRQRTLAEQEALTIAVLDARRDAERALRASEARFRAVFAGAAIGIAVADTTGRILEVNPALCEMLGYGEEELRDIPVTDLVHPDDEPGVWDLYGDMTRGRRDQLRVEKRYFRKDGSAIRTDLSVSLIRGGTGVPELLVAMVEDMTERYELSDRLRYQAEHDPLTRLPNRTLFFERLTTALETAEPDSEIGLCYLDLDGFKMVNDSLGHAIGDELLVLVAGRLAEVVGQRGHLVARMGGDEFVILLEPPATTTDVAELAQDILATLREPVHLAGHTLSVSASIGVLAEPVATSTVAHLMKAADITLYWAKSDGRARWALFDPERHQHDQERYALASAMPAALADGEFVVEYQPMVRLADGELTGVEALVRWHHPRLGRLMPDSFIGLAEETGLIVDLGRWVLAEACRQAAQWHRDFPDAHLVLSVNLAARQARDDSVVDDVARVLKETGLPAEYLQLELTESAVMSSAGSPLPSLRRLSALGVRIAIDDFGTGYSNLAYLRTLPIQALKLAGPFVSALRTESGADQPDQQVLDALVRLAHALGLTVTAEAVETGHQASVLYGLGCDNAQGWYYAPAAPAADVVRRLRERGD
jgi:diguanylate cyclase (GGDEF)-like protein/PAS domain S-box-containing protein